MWRVWRHPCQRSSRSCIGDSLLPTCQLATLSYQTMIFKHLGSPHLLAESCPAPMQCTTLFLSTSALRASPMHQCMVVQSLCPVCTSPKSITDTMMEQVKNIREKLMSGRVHEKPPLEKYKLRDTFVFTSNTIGSTSVLGVDAQVVVASLDSGGSGGHISNPHLLYNVDTMPDTITSGLNVRPPLHRAIGEEEQLLRLQGCKPIRAAGRKGHMRLQWAFETLLTTLRVRTERGGFTTWLACATADQKVAIVQSPKRSHWVNFSIPFPVQREEAISQSVWCPRGHEDDCFEVWSSPNPNEMST